MIRLVARAEPLAIEGVYARGAAGALLAQRIASRLAIAPRLLAVATTDALVVLGEPDALPWVDGAVWLGREPAAPALFVPTWATLTPHPGLVLGALRSDASTRGSPIAIVPGTEGLDVIPLAAARAPSGDALVAWATRGAA